jgi:PKD repeat protein
MTKTNYISVTSPLAPVAQFTGSPLSGSSPLNIQFTDNSTNTPTSWLWNFGDNTTSTLKNPSHIYQNAGTYSVTLTVTNNVNSSTLTKTNYITVSQNLISNFTSDKISGNGPTTINFTDLSTGSPTSWLWNFGDGTMSTVKNPVKTYNNKGTYNVSLKVTNNTTTNTLTKTRYITITTNPPVTNFTGNPVSGTHPLNVTFTDTSTNNPIRWSWNFGDNTTSNLKNPFHVYTKRGNYTVKLITTNAYGSSSTTKIRYINVL